MTDTYPRDMVGYGGKLPDPKWPNGARLAVNFVINFEEGSEYSFVDGDGRSEASAEGAFVNVGGQRDLAANRLTSTAAGSGSGVSLDYSTSDASPLLSMLALSRSSGIHRRRGPFRTGAMTSAVMVGDGSRCSGCLRMTSASIFDVPWRPSNAQLGAAPWAGTAVMAQA